MSIPEKLLREIRRIGVEEMYEDHQNPTLSAIKTLASHLGAKREVQYPSDCSGRCDLVLDDPPHQACWIECKFAWTYMTDKNPGGANPSYRKHLIGSREESALKDVSVKLPSLLPCPQVGSVAFLLVVLHSVQLPLLEDDIAQLEAQGELCRPPWTKLVEPDWENPRNADCRLRAYCWHRRAGPSSDALDC